MHQHPPWWCAGCHWDNPSIRLSPGGTGFLPRLSVFFLLTSLEYSPLSFYLYQLMHGFRTGPIAIIVGITGQLTRVQQLAAKVMAVMQAPRTGYKHVLRWWLLVAILYIGSTLTTAVLTSGARWFYFTHCQNLGLVDIFPPTFWTPGANATCWLPEDADASEVEYGHLWNTWAEPGYNATALYHACNTIFWQ